MAKGVLVQPDLDFKRKILGLGAHDLSYCYQCGTCSVVCPLSTSENPFPRKEMVWVQWGLKERALGNSSIWLCHQCGVCSTYCPRDAKPSDVMGALKDYSIGAYAVPPFMGSALKEPKHLLVLFLIPALIFVAVLALLGNLTSLPEGRIVYSKFMPVRAVEAVFIPATVFVLVAGVLSAIRYWQAMDRHMGGRSRNPLRALPLVLLTILRHHRFQRCVENPAGTRKTHREHRPRAHLAVFYGFLALVVTTTSVLVGLYFFQYPTPWPWWHPVKLLGNLGGLAVVMGVCVFLGHRILGKGKAGKSAYSDWLLLWVLLLTTGTGYLTQWLRMADLLEVAYPSYIVHLVFIFFLLVYLPYSKLAHLGYQTVALLYEASAHRQESAARHP